MLGYYIYQRGGKGIIETIIGSLIFVLWFTLLATPNELPKLILPISFALILGGVTKMEANHLVSSHAILNYIGNASYSIYLTHEAIEGLLLKICIKTHIAAHIGANLTFILTLAGTIGLGCGAYALCEQPLINWTRQIKTKWASSKLRPAPTTNSNKKGEYPPLF